MQRVNEHKATWEKEKKHYLWERKIKESKKAEDDSWLCI